MLPSLTLASRYNGDKFEVGDIVEIIAVGRNCDHIALVVNGKWVATQNGNRFSYNYVVEQAGEIEIYVAARNVPGLKGGTYIETEPVKFEGIEIPRKSSLLYPNGGVSGDVIMFDQTTGIPIERGSLKVYKGGKVFASLQSFLAVYEGQYRVVRRTAYNVKYEFNNGDVLEYDVYETKNEEKAKKPIKITYANGYVEYPDFESERDIFDIWLLMLDVQILARLVGCEDSVCIIESAGNNVTCFVGGPAVQELIDRSTMSSKSINFLQGMWNGAVDSGKGTVQLVTDFPEVVENMVALSKDIAIAIKDPNSVQRKEYREIIDVIILQAQLAKDDDAAKMLGYITGGVLFEIALAKGAGIAAKNLKTLVKTEAFLDALNKTRIGSMTIEQVIKIAKAINKITSAADDFLNDVAGKIVKLRDGIAVKLALSVIDDPSEAYALIKNSQLSDISKIESIAKEAGRFLEIDEIAPDIADSVKNVRKNGDVLELLDGDGNVLRTMSETVAEALESLGNIGVRYSDDAMRYVYKAGTYKPTAVTASNWEALEGIATNMYSSFRTRTDDILKVAQNTGWDIKDIEQIKRHIFLDELRLDDGVRLLDPDYEMAVAWERLVNGEFYQNDILLLKHELYESTYYKAFDTIQRVAHNEANKIFNWQNLIESLR